MSTKRNPTPGPWNVFVPRRLAEGAKPGIDGPNGEAVAWYAEPHEKWVGINRLADAYLMAAAPELRDACLSALPVLPERSPVRKAIEAAIEKSMVPQEVMACDC